MRHFFIYLMLLLLAGLLISVKTCHSYRNEMNRLSNNQKALLSDVEYYRTQDSLSAAGTERLMLSNREFKKYCSELEKTVEKLNIKVKRLQSVSQTSVSTRYPISAGLRDTVVIVDTRRDTVLCLKYTNPWFTLEGLIQDYRFKGTIESRDTLVQIVHRVPRKFWFIRWGTKAIRQEVVSRNPYSRVSYTEYIELKK